MLKEFKEFALKGNVLDMAVGILIGAAFGLGLMTGPALGGLFSLYSLHAPAFAASALALGNAPFGILVPPASPPGSPAPPPDQPAPSARSPSRTWASSQAFSGAIARQPSTTRSRASAVDSQGPGGWSNQAMTPFHRSSSMRGWSMG